MTTKTWTGSSNTNWFMPGNWGYAFPPGAGDVAYLNAVGIHANIFISVTGKVAVGTIRWNTDSTHHALIDISSGSLIVGPSGGGTIFSGNAAYGTIELENTGSGSTLQLGTGSRFPGTVTGTLPSVVFANDGSRDATVVWDSSTVLVSSDLTLTNFEGHDYLKIDATGTLGNLSYGAGILTFKIGGKTYSVGLAHTDAGDYQTSNFHISTSGGIVTITSDYPCFLRGTRIATLRGEVAVENLRIGDLVVTAADGALPITWIGTRDFITRLVDEHHRATLLPIRIAAGALGEASPVRDLHVSPEHRLCVDNVLIPAGMLLNGGSITRAADVDVVQYFHIELPRHAVLYADGAPAESFLDTGNRNMFTNVLSALALGVDLDAPRQAPCLPVVTEGETLAAVRAPRARRAARIGLATTEDDNLHLLVDGVALRSESRAGDSVRFAVPAGARQVHVVSRSTIPSDLDPANRDRRRLGICFSALSLRDGNFLLDLAPGYAGFTTGFHAAEGGHRWTGGDALLPEDLTAAMPDGFTLELTLVRTGLRYPAPPQANVIPFAVRRPPAHDAERLFA
jgi:hypothetical protein